MDIPCPKRGGVAEGEGLNLPGVRFTWRWIYTALDSPGPGFSRPKKGGAGRGGWVQTYLAPDLPGPGFTPGFTRPRIYLALKLGGFQTYPALNLPGPKRGGGPNLPSPGFTRP